MTLRMRSHRASTRATRDSLGLVPGVAAMLRTPVRAAQRAAAAVAGVMAVWACVFALTVFAWLPAMHARTHQLQHAAGVACSHAHHQHDSSPAVSTNPSAAAHQVDGHAHNGSLPSPGECDICSQLLLALLCGAVPSLDPPLPLATLTDRIEVVRERVSARELAHLPPSRGPPVI